MMMEGVWQRLSFVWGVIRIASYSAWRFFFPVEDHTRPSLSVLVLGVQGIGKTTLLALLANETPPEPSEPTKGFAIKAIQTSSCILDAKEIGGDPKLRPHWHRYYHQAHGLIVVVSDLAPITEQLQLARELLLDKRIFGPRLLIANLRHGVEDGRDGPAHASRKHMVESARALVDSVNASGQITFPVSFRAATRDEIEMSVRPAVQQFGAHLLDAATQDPPQQRQQ